MLELLEHSDIFSSHRFEYLASEINLTDFEEFTDSIDLQVFDMLVSGCLNTYFLLCEGISDMRNL